PRPAVRPRPGAGGQARQAGQGQAPGRHRDAGAGAVGVAQHQGQRPARPRWQGPPGDPLQRPGLAGRRAGEAPPRGGLSAAGPPREVRAPRLPQRQKPKIMPGSLCPAALAGRQGGTRKRDSGPPGSSSRPRGGSTTRIEPSHGNPSTGGAAASLAKGSTQLPYEVHMSRVCDVTGKRTTTGNNVSHAMNKTRRRFMPNLHERRFWVASENRWVKLRVSANAMRTIDKNGIDAVLADLRARGEKI